VIGDHSRPVFVVTLGDDHKSGFSLTLPLYAGIHKVEGFYRMLIRRFPFAPYNLIDDDTIAISAILDCQRDPNGLRKRLGGSEALT
jgi:hypothetical protein